jgi:hypothetical protein
MLGKLIILLLLSGLVEDCKHTRNLQCLVRTANIRGICNGMRKERSATVPRKGCSQRAIDALLAASDTSAPTIVRNPAEDVSQSTISAPMIVLENAGDVSQLAISAPTIVRNHAEDVSQLTIEEARSVAQIDGGRNYSHVCGVGVSGTAHNERSTLACNASKNVADSTLAC